MATRKQARRKSLIQILALIIAVVILVVAAVLFQNWWNNRPDPNPEDISITASVGDKSIDIGPYLVCEPGVECPEGEVPNLTVGPDDTLVLKIPEAIHKHRWQVLSIYDDPAANDEQIHDSYDTDTVEIPGSVPPIEASTGKTPTLQVVEVSAVLISTDANGEETPVRAVWSLSTMDDAELARARATEDAEASASPAPGDPASASNAPESPAPQN